MKSKTITSTILIALVISACGAQPTSSEPTPDVAAVRTSAASTVVSQFTLTAAVFTPTPSEATEESAATEEAIATNTQPVVAVQVTNASGTPETLCDSLGFDVATVDVNIPDNTIVTPGQQFIKTWKVRNTGSCPWGAGYVLAYAGYETNMSGQFIAMTEVIQPGQEVEVSVQFTAPTQAGLYTSAWSMRNPAGAFFPLVVFVKIIVQ